MSQSNGDKQTNENKPEKFAPVDAIARVELENGRWVVYLNVQSWQPNDERHPIANNWKRINDYSTEKDAKVAASWYERSANRTIRPPTGH